MNLTRQPVGWRHTRASDRGRRCRYGARDGGSAAIEAAIAVTSLLLVAFFIIGALRLVGTSGDVDAAARAGARAAATVRHPDDAPAAARRVASEMLADRGVACRDLAVQVDGTLAAGTVVAVDVRCTVALSDVVLVGFPTRRTLSGHGTEQVDVLRGGAP